MLSLPKYFLKKGFILSVALTASLWMASCSTQSNPEEAATATEQTAAATAQVVPAASDKGVGPISNVTLTSAPEQAMVDKGKAIFEGKCSACHKFGERYVGPDLSGVTQKRKPEWIMNMVLNPQEMLQKDATAQELLAQFMTQMPNQNLTEEEARAVLEYFRTK
jgi:mono/diheme cytochrome c family protein